MTAGVVGRLVLRRAVAPALVAAALVAAGACPAARAPAVTPPHDECFRVVLDPGHGGKPEPCGKRSGEHWDPYQQRFLNVFRYGVEGVYQGRRWAEHELVLALARKVKRRLDQTLDDAEWPKFERLARELSGAPGPLPRERISCRLTRDDNYLNHPDAGKPNVNRHYRLFDSPERFPYRPGDPMAPGRTSKIVQRAPALVVCLHVNGLDSRGVRAMNALYVPDFAWFDGVRQALLSGRGPSATPKGTPAEEWWMHGPGRSGRGWMVNDTWTYFTGYGCEPRGRRADTGCNMGLRQDDMQWAYRASVPPGRVTTLAAPLTGPFWERERGAMERRRRAGGLEGRGGDNLFAGMELVRWLRYGLWRDIVACEPKLTAPDPAAKGARRLSSGLYLGPRRAPTAADWAVPLFSNAVTAFLELGYLTNRKDFWILRNKLDVMADAMAVGIYSLRVGTKPRPLAGLAENPRGRPVDWRAYRRPDGSWYFDEARVVPLGPVALRPTLPCDRIVGVRRETP